MILTPLKVFLMYALTYVVVEIGVFLIKASDTDFRNSRLLICVFALISNDSAGIYLTGSPSLFVY